MSYLVESIKVNFHLLPFSERLNGKDFPRPPTSDIFATDVMTGAVFDCVYAVGDGLKTGHVVVSSKFHEGCRCSFKLVPFICQRRPKIQIVTLFP